MLEEPMPHPQAGKSSWQLALSKGLLRRTMAALPRRRKVEGERAEQE